MRRQGVITVCERDICDGIGATIETLSSSHCQAQVSFVAAAYATGHSRRYLGTDRAVLFEQGFGYIQEMLQRCRQVCHDGGSKMPTVSQGRGQLMADTATQAGFGHSNGQVVLPNEVGNDLFVFELVYAKDGLPKALADLGVEGIN